MGSPRKIRVAAPATQVGIGHNGGPDMDVRQLFKLIGPRKDALPEIFEGGAPWTGHASDEELKRLGTVQGRIARRERALKELKAERTRIMNRCIRRMRRKDGRE